MEVMWSERGQLTTSRPRRGSHISIYTSRAMRQFLRSLRTSLLSLPLQSPFPEHFHHEALASAQRTYQMHDVMIFDWR